MLGLKPAAPTRETAAFTRYADRSPAPDADKYIFQQPRGEPLKRAFVPSLYKFQKPKDHWDQLRRSKSYLADDFFPPINLKSNDLITLFAREEWRESEENTDGYQAWREDLMVLLPKLGVDALIELVYYLSFEAKLNDKYI